MKRNALQNFDELPLPEQIRLVQDLWDRISRNRESVQPTDEQQRELERRLRPHEGDPKACESWEQLRRRLTGTSE